LEVKHFKCETKDAISLTKENLEILDAALKDLPNTITIASTQVYRTRDNGGTKDDVPILTIEDSLNHHAERMDNMEIHTSNEISKVVQWVTDQKKEEENKINSLREAVETLEIEMKDTISYAEVEDKIATKVRELVDQIKEALLAVEEDEADFKNVAHSLHGLFNSLKESKADKSEMAQLRNQIISAQLNQQNQPPSVSIGESKGGVLDYKGLRKILSSYSKSDIVDKKLEGKAGREFTSKRLDHTENMIDRILETIDELWFVVRNLGPLSQDNDSDKENDRGEEPTNKITATPSENIRQSLVSIEEEDQSKMLTQSKSFSLGKCNQSIQEELLSQTTRPKTAMTLQRIGSATKVRQRPDTSEIDLSYYLTSKSKRRDSTQKPQFKDKSEAPRQSVTDSKHHVADKDLFIGNTQGTIEKITHKPHFKDKIEAPRQSTREAKCLAPGKDLYISNSQDITEKVTQEESNEVVGLTRRKTQFFEGRATSM